MIEQVILNNCEKKLVISVTFKNFYQNMKVCLTVHCKCIRRILKQ